jgi:hypothetical protein
MMEEDRQWQLSGRFVPPRRRVPDPLRQLLAAIILQALGDALDGDACAAAWMDEVAPQLAPWLDLDTALLAAWRTRRLRRPEPASRNPPPSA